MLVSPSPDNMNQITSKILAGSLRTRSKALAEIMKPNFILISVRSDRFHLHLELQLPKRLFAKDYFVTQNILSLFCHQFHILSFTRNTCFEQHHSATHITLQYPILQPLGIALNWESTLILICFLVQKSSVSMFCLKMCSA